MQLSCIVKTIILFSFSSSPSDSTVDVEFYALCNNTSVSRLKLTETVFMLNQFALYPEFPANLFSVPVLSPKVSEVGFQTNRTVNNGANIFLVFLNFVVTLLWNKSVNTLRYIILDNGSLTCHLEQPVNSFMVTSVEK